MTAAAVMAPLRAKNGDNLEFATNVPDKEERKRVRRLRVERAIAAQDKDGLDTSKNDEETASCSLSQQQVGVVAIRDCVSNNKHEPQTRGMRFGFFLGWIVFGFQQCDVLYSVEKVQESKV